MDPFSRRKSSTGGRGDRASNERATDMRRDLSPVADVDGEDSTSNEDMSEKVEKTPVCKFHKTSHILPDLARLKSLNQDIFGGITRSTMMPDMTRIC